MDEKEIEAIFKQYAKCIIKKTGKDGLFDDTINKICKKLFDKQWHGANGVDLTKFKNGYQIINLDTSKQSGSHWVSVYIKGKNCYIFDSFSRSSNKILKSLIKKLKAKKYNIFESDRKDKEQSDESEVCGQLSISWLYVVQTQGIDNAMLI